MVYKIIWINGGETASRYSSRKLANNVLKNSRYNGRVVKTKLTKPKPSQTKVLIQKYGEKPYLEKDKRIVWVKRNIKSGNIKGFAYYTRKVSALSKAEKKRVVRV